MKTSDFDYELPKGFIAQEPVEPRDASRLLVYFRDSGEIQHAYFKDLGQFLQHGDLLALNKTRVIPGRLYARKVPSGGRIEVLLLNQRDSLCWEALVGGKGLTPGKTLKVEDGPQAVVAADLGGSRRLIRFERPIEADLDSFGHVPLPPYIHSPLADQQRYQTVYAVPTGSAAAPTAGLHFTPELLENLRDQGVKSCEITLHIGLDTFAPVTEEYPQQHLIHTEWCQVDEIAAAQVNETHRKGNRIIAVGTTSVRALENAARFALGQDIIGSYTGVTDLFILPGYSFQVVDALITNFHLPRSTLIMLVSAFTGWDRILEVYRLAIREGYRFYSFGDAMLII
ncbi:MAG: tRNA preQ1(34) S-adenosylmethionine ribosyltransferase-isomerase QueA [Chloroflexi bacterium RBG_16_54_18]|nr:MAG: tRNA preQ1(34) S-adenosylmethionine ribosyltransferase-isomerase QueA [Chloroflexi bacterium RBG_16_54_18]